MKARGRPAGLTRQALRQVFAESGGQPMTWRALAQRAQVGYAAARYLADHMARAGELTVLESIRQPGVNRPVRLYAPAAAMPARPAAGAGVGAPVAVLERAWNGKD